MLDILSRQLDRCRDTYSHSHRQCQSQGIITCLSTGTAGQDSAGFPSSCSALRTGFTQIGLALSRVTCRVDFQIGRPKFQFPFPIPISLAAIPSPGHHSVLDLCIDSIEMKAFRTGNTRVREPYGAVRGTQQQHRQPVSGRNGPSHDVRAGQPPRSNNIHKMRLALARPARA